MSLSFQDWSGLVSRKEIEPRYQRNGWSFPETGPCLVKVYPADEESVEDLRKWAKEKGLRIHLPENKRARIHVDLYGPNLDYCQEEEVLSPEQVKEIIREKTFDYLRTKTLKKTLIYPR